VTSIIKFLRRKKEPKIESYSIKVLSFPQELERDGDLPLELQYIKTKKPELFEKLKKLLSGNKAIGIRTTEQTPQTILDAVNEISVRSQHRMILTWLPQLLWSQEEPHITDADRAEACKDKKDLDECVTVILKHRFAFKRFVLIDEANEGTAKEELALIADLNQELYPLTIHYIVERIIADNAHERTAVAQAIIKALIIIGPITHALETVAAGIGKVFAASTDDLLAEAAELAALRGSGFTWKKLAARSKILVPVFILATYGAFRVEDLIEIDRMFLAGLLFGFSAIALSLTTAIQSIRMYHESVVDLVHERKYETLSPRAVWKLAFLQDFTNPARLGLLIGAIASPIIAGSIFAFFPHLTHNGWILAMLGTTETMVAGLTVLIARTIGEWMLTKELESAIEAAQKGAPWAEAQKFKLKL
jgi:hypothetical protein